MLRLDGTPDDSVVDESPHPRHDPFIEELNKKFRESQEKTPVKKNEN